MTMFTPISPEAQEAEPPVASKPGNPVLHWALIVVFLGIIFAPPVYHEYIDQTRLSHSQFSELMERPNLDGLHLFESSMIQHLEINKALRLAFTRLRTRGWFPPRGVILGRGNILFIMRELDVFAGPSMMAPPPSVGADSLDAIVDFNAQLRRRGVHMVFLPIPMKLSIYPDAVVGSWTDADGPALPDDWAPALDHLRQQGVDVLDLVPLFWKNRNRFSEPLFWKGDTHWSITGRNLACDEICRHLLPFIGGAPRVDFDDVVGTEIHGADMRRFVSEEGLDDLFPDEAFKVHLVLRNGKPFLGGNNARVLILGDSYVEIQRDAGWGLEQELMRRLHIEVQSICKGGIMVNEKREELAANPDALKAKKVVILECAGRYFYEAWKRVTLR